MRWFWILGFGIGALVHAWDIVRGGTHVYAAHPWSVRVFWSSLVVIDPLVVLLLMRRQRGGVALGVLTIAVDYTVDVRVSLPLPIGGIPGGLVRLTLFAVLVGGTAPMLWRALSS